MSWPTDMGRRLYFFCAFFLMMGPMTAAAELAWQEQKGEHFIVYAAAGGNNAGAGEILNKAESYYTNIAQRLGFARYDHFWTWDSRLKIYIYPDKESYLKETGQPSWSVAAALRDRTLMEKKTIVTFGQEEDFLDGTLPHEISHFILRDFIGFDKDLPLWFDEGVAQLQESGKAALVRRLMKGLVKNGHYIPVNQLVNLDIRGETDNQRVAIFYVQSVSIVDFLIEQYGSSDFGQLCHAMKAGKDFESALKASYGDAFGSLEELQKKWVNYFQN